MPDPQHWRQLYYTNCVGASVKLSFITTLQRQINSEVQGKLSLISDFFYIRYPAGYKNEFQGKENETLLLGIVRISDLPDVKMNSK